MATMLILEGIVQGVGCRHYCSLYAKALNIKGAASNLKDGSVKLVLLSDDQSIISDIIFALKNNTKQFSFHGHIKTIQIYNNIDDKYTHFGDYTF